MKVEVTNGFSRCYPEHLIELKALDEQTSYPVEGAQFSAAFKNHVWDGRQSLVRKSRHGPYWLCPTGVLPDIDPDLLGNIELVDARRHPGERLELEWIGPELRPYQEHAIAEVLKDRGVFTGKGMLNLPIRSGKTKTTAGLIQRLGVRTLFVVPSDMLLDQTLAELRNCIADCPVAGFGAGDHDTDWITVATVQSLLANKKAAAKLLAECDLLIIDEAHHMEGEAWRNLALKSDAFYKIGLSATIFVSREKQNNTASIWLKACTGPILDRISMNYLFKHGYLIRPDVLFYTYAHGEDRRSKDWQWVARELIANNRGRNKLIVDLAAAAAMQGLRVMVDTGRHDQERMIAEMGRAAGMNVATIDGNTPRLARQEVLRQLKMQEVQMVVGTVLGEGIDIPELEVVINAEGQKKATAAIQRLRNLTPSKDTGKDKAFFIDIADVGNKILSKHSLERLTLYRGLRGFRVRSVKRGSPNDPFHGDGLYTSEL